MLDIGSQKWGLGVGVRIAADQEAFRTVGVDDFDLRMSRGCAKPKVRIWVPRSC